MGCGLQDYPTHTVIPNQEILYGFRRKIPLCAVLISQATHLSLGVGFVAAYAPNRSSGVWVQPFDTRSNVFGECGRWHHLQIPIKGALVRQVVCGRSHLVALTTEDEGM